MSDEDLGARREEAFSYVSSLADRAARTMPTVNPGHLWTVLEMASEAEKFRGLLGMMNKAYLGLRERKNAEILDLTERLDAAESKVAKLHRVMGVGERMGDSDDTIMKEIRQVLWHG
jgi:hypothetical protein